VSSLSTTLTGGTTTGPESAMLNHLTLTGVVQTVDLGTPQTPAAPCCTVFRHPRGDGNRVRETPLSPLAPNLGGQKKRRGALPLFTPGRMTQGGTKACSRCPETDKRQAATPHIFLRVCVTGFEEIQDTHWQGFGGVLQFLFPHPPRLGDQRGLKRRLRTGHKVPAGISPGCHRVATRSAMKQDTLILSSQHYVNYSVVQRIPHVL
jgi:hypothetical protein